MCGENVDCERGGSIVHMFECDAGKAGHADFPLIEQLFSQNPVVLRKILKYVQRFKYTAPATEPAIAAAAGPPPLP
jgi:hypothetical protein